MGFKLAAAAGCTCRHLLGVASLLAALGPSGSEEAIVAKDPCDETMGSDFGWLQAYIKIGFFTDFKYSAWRFYELNETSYAFLWLNSISFSNLDFVREACPEAARLALLLRAEERLPIREADHPLLEYAALSATPPAPRASPGSSAGAVADWPWPLARGIERLRLMVTKLSMPEEYAVDVVMPYCAEPLDGLLSRKTGYDDEWLSVRVPFRHVRLILYRLQVCAPEVLDDVLTGEAALASLPSRAAEAARHFAAVEVVRVDARPEAWEAARYFLHLTQRYERLADFTLFLHPDVLEHVNPRTLRNLLHSLRVGTFRLSGLADVQGDAAPWYEYVSLSHHYLTRPSRVSTPSVNCTRAELSFHDVHRLLFAGEGNQSIDGVQLGDFGFYCCSQFMVHRDRVWRRPREWYRRVAEDIPWEHCATSYMEMLWHAVFNFGELHEQKRQERLVLPFFLRIDNFIETTSDGLV